MINQKVILIGQRMDNIQKFLKSVEMLFSVEYIMPPLIIGGVFIWLFPVL